MSRATVPSNIRSQIRLARHEAGLSQTALADRIDCGQSYVAHLEAGTRRPNLEILRRIARATGATFSIDGSVR